MPSNHSTLGSVLGTVNCNFPITTPMAESACETALFRVFSPSLSLPVKKLTEEDGCTTWLSHFNSCPYSSRPEKSHPQMIQVMVGVPSLTDPSRLSLWRPHSLYSSNCVYLRCVPYDLTSHVQPYLQTHASIGAVVTAHTDQLYNPDTSTWPRITYPICIRVSVSNTPIHLYAFNFCRNLTYSRIRILPIPIRVSVSVLHSWPGNAHHLCSAYHQVKEKCRSNGHSRSNSQIWDPYCCFTFIR